MAFFSDKSRGNGKVPAALPPPLPIAAKSETAPLRPVPMPSPANTGGREPPCPGIYIAGHSYERPEFLVDRNLRRRLRRHYAKLFSPKLRHTRPPRIFFIVGWPGEGKTENLLVISSRAGIDIMLIAGADLGGNEPHLEGAPVATLQAAFTWMAWKSASTQRPFVLVIDDIDAGILPEKMGVERTNNTDQLIGKFQTICNSPALYTTADSTPVPLVWTANSSANIRPSLIRPGRCDIYRHELDSGAKAEIVEHLFRPTTDWERRQLRKLAARYRHQPVSWFCDRHAELSNNAIDSLLDGDAPLDLEAIEAAADQADRLDIDALYAAAARADANQGGDFSNTRS